MAVKIDMDMPKGCEECPLCYPKQLLSCKKICLWEQGYRYYRMIKGDKKASWEIPNEIKIGEKLPSCPLQEVNNKLPQNSACFDCAHTATCLWLKKHGPCYSCGSKKAKE